jgi:hypothetical protein
VADTILAVLSSTDGGQTWRSLNPQLINDNRTLTTAAGNAGYYNNCISVSPVDPAVVALGWRAGPFVSRDRGNLWRAYDDDNVSLPPEVRSPALHGDLHALRFSRTGQTLYIGSDGGIVSADVNINDPNQNFLGNFNSSYNMHLANLQFGGFGLGRSTYATFSINAGLAGGGLQDNSNVYCKWDDPNGPSPWRQIAPESDGKLTLVLVNRDLVFDNNSEPTRATRGRWDDNVRGWVVAEGVIPLWLGGESFDAQGLSGQQGRDFVVEPVVVPSLRSQFDQSQRILSVGGVLNTVYGLFADGRPAPSQHWEPLGRINIARDDFITATASYDGQAILVGTNSGRIFHFRPGSPAAEMAPLPAAAATVMHLRVNAAVAPALDAYAVCFGDAGKLIHLVNGSVNANQGNWDTIGRPTIGRPGGDPLWDLAVDWKVQPPALYVTNNIGVFVSHDQGNTWKAASDGLPSETACQGLRILQDKIFLSTWGRSAWVAGLPRGN